MPTNATQRPIFYEGQYLGAADLTAAIEYGRAAMSRHDLGGHTWGIAMGLQLKETPSPLGGDKVDVTILPGYAWDGFGRPIVLLQPMSLSGALFSQVSPDGNPQGILVPVWLRYSEIPTRGPKPGFERCDPGDEYARMQETFAIEVGTKTNDLKHDKINVAGRQVDAQGAVQAFLGANPPVTTYDESIPYQTLPDPLQTPPRWLVPIGAVRWLPGPDAFTPGNFVKAQPDDAAAARAMRRYIGVVAEEVAAADGTIRLRDRSRPYSPIRTGELVWVEGDLRVDEDLRMFGGNIDFRRMNGTDNDVSLLLHRAETLPVPPSLNPNTALRVLIGKAMAGENSFAVGISTDPTDPTKFVEKFVVKDSGQAGVGTGNVGKAALTIEHAQVPVIFRATGQPPANGGLWRVALDSGVLSFAANAAPVGDFSSANVSLKLTPDGKIGGDTAAGQQTLGIAGSAAIDKALAVDKANDNSGAINPGLTFGLNSGEGISSKRDSGGNRFGLDFYTASLSRMSITNAGRVGIGTSAPQQALSVSGALNIDQANANSGAINPGLTFGSNSGEGIASRRTPGANRFGLDFYTLFLPRMTITQGGAVGIGTTTPDVRLHVVDSKSGDAGDTDVHVALIENTDSGGGADVLALKVGTTNPSGGNNFITFFGGNSAVGSIEGDGGGVTLNSGSADFAECLPRLDERETLEPGDIVGIVEGKVTRTTEGAHAISAVTSNPIVLGNSPGKERAHLYARVAFVGQVAIKVRGPVNAGDLIVPSGLNDGVGMAAPTRLTPSLAVQVVGQAWASKSGPDIGLVIAAINLNAGQLAARLIYS
ncbi:MAG TPA: hypothetical protein VJ183_01520 [Chloroflexia bacterium]|nr:hypothetical protein [Chloroflexia bacterium]